MRSVDYSHAAEQEDRTPNDDREVSADNVNHDFDTDSTASSTEATRVSRNSREAVELHNGDSSKTVQHILNGNNHSNGSQVEVHNEPRKEKSEASEDDLSDEEENEGVGEEENEDEDEDEDEYEPALKYNLLGGSATKLLEKDAASALAISAKYLVS